MEENVKREGCAGGGLSVKIVWQMLGKNGNFCYYIIYGDR